MMYIAIGPNCWGKGATIKQAVAKMRQYRPANSSQYGYLVYEASDSATVDSVCGGISYTKGDAPPVLIKDTRPKKTLDKVG